MSASLWTLETQVFQGTGIAYQWRSTPVHLTKVTPWTDSYICSELGIEAPRENKGTLRQTASAAPEPGSLACEEGARNTFVFERIGVYNQVGRNKARVFANCATTVLVSPISITSSVYVITTNYL
jgi:hypothetical protein